MSYNPQNPNGQATSANSSPVVIASDQSAVPVSGTVGITANSSVNQTQIAGTAVDVNSGTKSAGTQRVVLATDQPQLTNALKVDGSAVTQPVSLSGTLLSDDNSNNVVPSATANKLAVLGRNTVWFNNNATWERQRGVENGANISGTGVTAAGVMAQFDDTSPTTITENNFGNVRMSANRNMYGTIRDAAGNERGANVNASNQLSVSVDNTPTVTMLPTATGGWSVNSQTALSNTKVAVKASAGTLGGYMVYNPNAAVSYIQVFDVASGSVTLGTTTPTYVIPIPPAAAANVEFTLGINHTTANTLAATTTATGSTAPSSALTGFFLFK